MEARPFIETGVSSSTKASRWSQSSPPGRLGRIAENPVTDLKEFVEQLLAEMRGLLDRPFAFFGHCPGALTMYETARRLIRTTGLRPQHLFASEPARRTVSGTQGRFEERVMRDLLKLAEYRISLPVYAQPERVFSGAHSPFQCSCNGASFSVSRSCES